ncbi:hypothetical protein [Chondromyces apiculatus]|nr:hypothetical protein [Chondromyces apiculatus]
MNDETNIASPQAKRQATRTLRRVPWRAVMWASLGFLLAARIEARLMSAGFPADGRAEGTAGAGFQPGDRAGTTSPGRPPLVLGIYGAGPTGEGYVNAELKALADEVGGQMFNGPGNTPESLHWTFPILSAIDAHYLEGGSTKDRAPATLVLFGYSMGGRAAVVVASLLARDRKYDHIRVALAGIDPVELGNSAIDVPLPANVVSWVNYYQHDERGEGIAALRWGWVPVDIDFARVSGSPFTPGPRTGPGVNHRLKTGAGGRTVDHVTLPSLPEVSLGLRAFVALHRGEKTTP